MNRKSSLGLSSVLVCGLLGCSPLPPGGLASPDDAFEPRGGLVVSGHALYGTTTSSGIWADSGTVYRLNADGTGYVSLHQFRQKEGSRPMAKLVLSEGTLYGTACEGGNAGGGTIFKVQTDGRDFAVLHDFENFTNPAAGGARPVGGLVMAGDTLYGTAQRGGVNEGTVFMLKTDGSDFKVLHTFEPLVSDGRDLTNRDGAFPQADLVLSGDTLYGTGWCGGSGGAGTLFALKTDGSGFKVLHHFARRIIDHSRSTGHTLNSDGAYLETGLILSGDQLYGTTSEGGGAGGGTLFKIKTDGSGFAVLHVFTGVDISGFGTNRDGGHPSGLVLAGCVIYGTTTEGGPRNRGTLFRIDPDSNGFTTLSAFANDDAWPGTIFARSGKSLYGTTSFGGKGTGGFVFRVDADGRAAKVLHSFIEKPLPPGLTD